MTITQTDLTDIIEKWGNGLIAISAAYEDGGIKRVVRNGAKRFLNHQLAMF